MPKRKELPKAYDPKKTEKKIYDLWLKSGFFNPDKLPKRHKKPFCITIPPPNVTGELHMGHALQHVMHDIIIRKKRMEGYKTLWLPGTDHAGIATQNKVEQKLKKEGRTRFDLGREKFIEEVWKWKEQYGNIIIDQMKQLGNSCDWSRMRFTMDKKYVKAVETAFNHYYQKGWIYKGLRVVNWCVRCGTSISDLELEYREEKGKLWFIKYPIKDTPPPQSPPYEGGEKWGGGNKLIRNRYIVVATTRPETMLGDAAVAVNPEDERYKDLIGRTVILPIQNREIPIIADETVDPKFGTGAVKVTPLHDFNDWEIAQSHKLQQYKIINERGRMTKEAGAICNGLNVRECREKVVGEIRAQGLLEKEEDFTHQVPHCYRCNSTIEPLASEQWFLKMADLAKTAIRAVKSGEVKFVPKRWEKVYLEWLKNVKDWNISRQLFWGHKIPIEGVEDVLDTWFSSALWPFATLGWPDKKSRDLKTFYPTDVMITDRGIINLWVARMIFSSYEFLGKKPFGNAIIHATVLAKDGQRMSKSLGTGVDPIGLIEKYGADATRFGMVYQAMGGQDIKFSEDHIIAGRKFCNKIWNIARFTQLQISNSPNYLISNKIPTPKTQHDKKILKKLRETTKLVDKYIENYQFGHATHTLYDFVWHDFADAYIEASKNKKNETVLLYTLVETLKLLHPFIPFITEKIYQTLPLEKKTMLLVENWPK
jgi:valyl-tRNA synthetase